MFREYTGEFLLHPAAVEINGDYCSHSCYYCFANLNAPGHKADKKAIANFLASLNDRTDVVALLMRQGYPVFISNHVDMFAVSNEWLFDVVKVLIDSGLSVMFQTRFGRSEKFFDYLKNCGRFAWQVTIETHSDEIGRKLSPGAPPISQRLKKIEQLVRKNHLCIVNMLPFAKEHYGQADWLDNFTSLLKKLKSIGVNGVWWNPLHLTAKQAKKVKRFPKDVYGGDLTVSDTQKVEFDYEDIAEAFIVADMDVYSPYLPIRDNIFYGIDSIYKKRLPTIHDYWDGFAHGQPLICDEFLSYYGDMLPVGVFNLRSYLITNGYDETLKRFVLPNNLTFHDLVRVLWGFADVWDENDTYSLGLNRKFLFVQGLKDKNKLLQDSSGNLIYVTNYFYDGKLAVDIDELEEIKNA